MRSPIFILLTIVCICLLSISLGAQMVFHHDYFFLYDQARDMMLVKSIVIDHRLTFIGTRSGIGGFFHGPIWLYLLTPLFILFHGDPIIMPIAGILVTIVTISVGYLVGTVLYNKWCGVLLALLLGVNSAIWSYISSILSVNVVPLIYLVLFYSLVMVMRGKPKYFLLSAFLTGLAFQFETASSLVLLPTICIVFLLQKQTRSDIRLLLGSIGLFCVSMSWYILFDLRHQFLMTKAVIQYMFTHTKENGFLSFYDRLTDHIHAFRDIIFSYAGSGNIFLAVLFLCIIFGGIYRVFQAKDKKYKAEVLLYLLFPIVIFLFLLRYPYPVYREYVLGILIPVGLLFIVATQTVWRYMIGRMAVIAFLVFLVGMTMYRITLTYVTSYTVSNSSGSLLNQLRVVDAVSQKEKQNKFGYFVYTPEVFTYGMDYLFWWQGTKNHFVATSEKLPDTYLILYSPLLHDTNAHTFWKKNVIHMTQLPLEKKVFPGNIIVERYHFAQTDPAPDPNYYQKLIFR